MPRVHAVFGHTDVAVQIATLRDEMATDRLRSLRVEAGRVTPLGVVKAKANFRSVADAPIHRTIPRLTALLRQLPPKELAKVLMHLCLLDQPESTKTTEHAPGIIGDARKRQKARDPLKSLSPRERDVFRLAANRHTNEQISRALGISLKTVQTHRAHINKKLDIHSAPELVHFAARHGFLSAKAPTPLTKPRPYTISARTQAQREQSRWASHNRPAHIPVRLWVGNLERCFPRIAAQWHPTKNGDLKPSEVLSGSGKKVWWKCPRAEDHEWLTTPNRRTNAADPSHVGCPFCARRKVAPSSTFVTVAPDKVKYWDSAKNGALQPKSFSAQSSKVAWWRCEAHPDHQWRQSIHGRAKDRFDCPFCAGTKRSGTLAELEPAVADEWHPTKNAPLTPHEVTVRSLTKVWWQCSTDPRHEWFVAVNVRTRVRTSGRKSGCPFCNPGIAHRVLDTNAPGGSRLEPLLSPRGRESAAE